MLDPIVEANRLDVLLAVEIADKMRLLVKDVYGDGYDVCVTNTAEASLRVAFETLVAPPTMRKGDQYRTRSLQIYGEDAEWGGGYGRAFPPKYRHFAMDRTVSGSGSRPFSPTRPASACSGPTGAATVTCARCGCARATT